uniref:Uncharacterized protein n=1 Tax=Octactis speculum TaxID=3111310 RepID=A0A7S2GL63_9STRA|mmetsp:Transcript_50109/g.68165  ORF Transcript_50109/g.68165 Transcript_50109/m.68165 type:complete len:254 (+) Transcript_50109:26-787(+)
MLSLLKTVILVVSMPSSMGSAYCAQTVRHTGPPSSLKSPRLFLTSSKEPAMKLQAATSLSGGAAGGDGVSSVSKPILGKIASAWGTFGVFAILMNPARRLLPIALQPFSSPGDLEWWGWAISGLWCVFMGYAEGYKGFQRKFSPMVVSRAYTLSAPVENRPKGWWLHAVFAPFYSMGLFHATKKRLVVSWSFIFGIGLVVAGVKRLPYPWRAVIDGGVVVGLTWGATAIALGYLHTIVTGIKPSKDPQLPKSS